MALKSGSKSGKKGEVKSSPFPNEFVVLPPKDVEKTQERVAATQTVLPKPAVNNAQRNGASANMSGSILQFAKSLAEVDKPVPLPAGEYTAEIRGAEVKTSENTGNQYIALTMHISADQYPADYTDGDPDGTILSYNRLSPKATPRNLWNMRQFVEALGLVAGTEVDLNDWLGKAVTVGVSIQKYEGEDRAQISRIVYGA